MRKSRAIIVGLTCTATSLLVAFPHVRAGQSDKASLVPSCFLSDTVYHVEISLSQGRCRVWYGEWNLVSCPVEWPDDKAEVQTFAEEWRTPGKPPWQTVKRRGVWSGKPAVSDTVIEVVSEVAKVDPELIKRVYPDRFQVDLTGGFRLRIHTSEGASQTPGLAELWNNISSRFRSFGRLQTLTFVVTPEDAQTLYYALEPGTPVLLQ